MSQKKVLLTGASGFLGWHFLNSYSSEYQTVGLYASTKFNQFENIEWTKVDFLNPADGKAAYQLLETEQPDFVLNFAAAANPNFCEENPEISRKLNFDLPIAFSNSCQHFGIKFLHCSTDLVFDGKRGDYQETDPVNPISIYGKDKADADQYILETNKNALVVRLPLMYGITPKKSGFFQNWVKKLQSGEKLFAFTDEYRTAANAERVVQGIRLLIENNETGLFHLGGLENISRFDFATRLSQFLKIKTPQIVPSERADVKMSAARPRDVSLNSDKAKSKGYSPKYLEEEFDYIFTKMKNNFP